MERNLTNGTSFHQSDKPIFCANGCGFFGTAATMNLCSKCYLDLRLKEEQAASIAKSIMTSSSGGVTTSPSGRVMTSSPVAERAAEVTKEVVVVVKVKVKSRCGNCNKKVGVMGFECRCVGPPFVGPIGIRSNICVNSISRVLAGREAIKKANPIVKADKIERL